MDLDKMFLKTFLKNFNDIPFTIRFADGEEMVLGTEPSKFKLILNAPLRKKELLTLNWKDTKLAKFIDIEKILKNQIRKNEKYLIIVNGSEEYINIINECIERYFEKSKRRIDLNNVKIIDFYEVGSFNDNIKEIFEGYEKQELKINA